MTDDTLADGLAAQADAAPGAVAALYDDWVMSHYDADLAAWGYDAPARAADMLSKLLSGSLSERPLLDAGCGSGLVGAELRRCGLQPIVGGDFSAASVETARSRGLYSDVVQLDLNLPLRFADGQFRAVASIGVFSYLTDSEATVRELLRVVEVGGPVVFTQRTDLWDERNFDRLLSGLSDEGACDVTVSHAEPYLPLHPEFGAGIGIRYATLTRSSERPSPLAVEAMDHLS